MKLRKSPFKTDKIEDNPHSFALRPKEIQFCANKLFNSHNVLITGPRGIGKTSFAKQLQLFYQNDKTLLQRCDIDASFPTYLCAFYKCDKTTTLANMSLDILRNIEQECLLLKRYKLGENKKVKIEFNIGVFKAALENELTASSPASVATQFINGLRELYTAAKLIGRNGMCVLLDESDMVSNEINLADFLRLVHEYADHYSIDGLSMILTGQSGTYSRLLQENASVERMIFHVPLTKLAYEESKHIVNFASENSNPPFVIDEDACDTILKIAAGYPYVVHLLGDGAFGNMADLNQMTLNDVLNGLRIVLRSDKQEKYLEYLSRLKPEERTIITKLSAYEDTELPVQIPFDWMFRELGPAVEKKQNIKSLNKLHQKGYMILDRVNKTCQFNDELFRIFLRIRGMEMLERGQGSDISDDVYDRGNRVSYNENEIDDVIKFMTKAEINRSWVVDEFAEMFIGDDEFIEGEYKSSEF